MRGANLRLLLNWTLLVLAWIPIGSINPPPVSAQQDPNLLIVANDALAERASQAVADAYSIARFDTRQNSSATLANLCAGEFGVLATTTPPSPDDFSACSGIVEMLVAIDGTIVIVSTQVDFLTCLDTGQLTTLFGTNGPRDAEVWNQLDPNFPESRVSVFATPNQTLKDFFYQRVIGEANGQRRGTESFGDEPYRQINSRQGGIGIVPLAEYFGSPPTYGIVSLNNGTLCQPPTERIIAEGEYPAARPVYWYARRDPSLNPDALYGLLVFLNSPEGSAAIQQSGAWPVPADLLTVSIRSFQSSWEGPRLSSDAQADFMVRLTWQSSHDLDLGLYLPNGFQVNFTDPAAPGFYREADSGNDYCAALSPSPHEQIIALDGIAYPTDYLAYVQLSLLCGNTETSASFTLEFLVDGQVVNSTTGTIAQGENPFVFTFSYPGS